MNPLEQQIEELRNEIKALRQVRDLEFIQELKRRAIGGVTVTGDSTTGMEIAVRNAADTGSETVADDYAGGLKLTDAQGNTYRLGYYS